MKRFPSLNYPAEVDELALGDVIYAQEKLDGANFRFTLSKHVDGVERDGLVFGSRNVVWKNEKDVAKAFDDHPETGVSALDFVRTQIDLQALRSLDREGGGLVFFGEAMHPHTLDYRWDQTPRVIIYDVYSMGNEEFQCPSVVKTTCRSVGLSWSPYVDSAPPENCGLLDVPQSSFRDGKAEGIVIKNPETGARAKIVTEDFKEKHGGPSPASGKNNITDTDIVVDRFITKPRIQKHAHGLVDAGEWDRLQMEMMVDLPERVIRDAMNEEAANFVMQKNYTVDTGELRSTASTKCARVLRGMLQ